MFYYFLIASQIVLSLNSNTLANPLIGDNVKLAKKGEFPFIVSIGLEIGSRGHFCTGSLITYTHVLTAAHCFKIFGRARNIRVLVGTNDLNHGGTKYRLNNIDSWITYDDWAYKTNQTNLSKYEWNDIAIITLSRKVEENIPLPIISYAKDDQHYGKTAVTAGWGAIKNGSKPNYLHKTSLNVMTKTEFERNMVALGYPKEDAQDNELCTTANPSMLLGYGDSGGPLLINGNEIIGVNEAVCPKDQPEPKRAFNLHTSIDYYRQFIGSVTSCFFNTQKSYNRI